MDAWDKVAARLQEAHKRHMHILATMKTIDSVQMANDGADEARILLKLKAVLFKCTETQDFSEFNILCAAMTSPDTCQ